MKEEYKNYLLTIKNLIEEEQLNELKKYRRKLINKYNKKFDKLFEIKHYLAVKDSKYDDIYNDDIIEEMFQDIEYEEYDTIDKCKNIIDQLIVILEKLDEEINYCNKLKQKEEKIPNKIDIGAVNALDEYVPLLAQKSLRKLKKEKSQTPRNDEMYVLLDRAIEYKKNKKRERNKLYGVFIASLLFDNKPKQSNNSIFENYEPFNFEEQELEEDDFHYDDLD